MREKKKQLYHTHNDADFIYNYLCKRNFQAEVHKEVDIEYLQLIMKKLNKIIETKIKSNILIVFHFSGNNLH